MSDSPVAAASTSVTASPAAGPARFGGVIALDGPSGTGKSTVARQLARRLGARYLDTGAMYRAATLAVLRAGVAPDDADAVVDVLRQVSIDVGTDPDRPGTRLSGQPVDREIRSAAVTGAVSAVAAIPAVRARLVARQRELITGATASGLADIAGIVVEGRDIGSVVWPQAEIKIYLTASAEERAKRRARELADSDLAAVQADLSRRDRLDSSRPISPLQQAPGAVELDTTGIDVDGVVAQVLALIGARRHDR